VASAKILPLPGERLLQVTWLVVGMTAIPCSIVAADTLVQDGAVPSQNNSAALVWSDYQAIMWQPHRAEQCAALKSLGITAGAVISDDRDNPADSAKVQVSPLLSCGLGAYVENIATDFYSAYHRWSPGHPVNWRFVETKQAYQKNPLDPAAVTREPSLSDPAWQEKVRDRLAKTVRAYAAYRPLYYSLGDETGIGDLSAFWDFDFSDHSLAAMRHWLEAQYGTLAALNQQWGSQFATWDAVVPMTTAQAMRRTDENYSAWADFKAWMDVAFAEAVAMGTRAVHAADPSAYAAIEGAQVPGWGGYDYSHLATAVDVMEIYDGGGNLEIARALNPQLVMLTTSFSSGPREAHDIWRELLRGSRGVVLWDEKNEIVANDATIGPRGRALAATLHEIESGIGALLGRSERQMAPVALLYSPASMRTQWMLDWQPKGDAWSARDAQSDYEDESAVRSSMERFLSLLEHRGLEPRVVVSESIENGALGRDGLRALILPRTIALSARAAAEIARFAADGGTVIADGEPGLFDEHSRRLATPVLAQLFTHGPDPAPASFPIGKGRGVYLDAVTAAPERLDQILAEAGIEPTIRLSHETGEPVTDTEIYRWQNGNTTILALHRDAPGDATLVARVTSFLHAKDDGQRVLTLSHQAYVYDLRAQRLLGHVDRLGVTLDTVTPTLLAISPVPRDPLIGAAPGTF
jgi:hypothetical protein